LIHQIFRGGVADALNIVKTKLQQAAGDDQLFEAVFGEKANTLEIKTVREQWAKGIFEPLSAIQVISAADMNGADGAYASSTQKIYLSDALSKENIAPVVVEETFHWLDDRVGTDTKGDEGELARNLIFGVQLSDFDLTRIRSEDDRGLITVNGQQVAVEFAAVSASATSLQKAQNIGVLGATSQVFTGSVGGNINDNYLKFQVTAPSAFTANLTGMTRNANLRLFNEQGSLIQGSYNTGTAADSINFTLNTGIYYADIVRERTGEVVSTVPGADVTNYSLGLSAPTALVRVTSPNGGNSIQRGTVANITWQDNISENVRIDLYNNGTFYRNITDSTPSTGSFNWSVPTDIVSNTASSTPNWVSLGSNYQIRVQSVTNSAIVDSSDANFAITGKTSNDLLGTTLVLTQSAAKAGDTVNVSYAVRNDGTDAVGAFKVGFYLSNDPKSNAGDVLLGEIDVNGLAAKSTGSILKSNLVLPAQGNAFWKGDKGYFIKAVADYKNVIVETNEANNVGQAVGNDYSAIAVTGTVPVIIDGAGNTQGTARNIGTLTTTQTFNDLVGVNDKEDWYSFYIAEPGIANISVNSDKGVTIEVYKGSNMLSRNSTATNLTRPEYIDGPGQYFVKISQYAVDQDSNYSLALSTTSSVSDIGSLSGNRSVTGKNNIGYYRFKLDQNSVVIGSTSSPNLIWLSGVLDSNYKLLPVSVNGAGATLNAGTYYVSVSNVPGVTTPIPSAYTLNLQATATSRYDNAGNYNYGNAKDLGTLSGTKNVVDYLDATDLRDDYSFTIDQKSSLNLNVVALLGSMDIGVSIYDSNNKSIAFSSGYSTPLSPIVTTLDSGKYFISLQSWNTTNVQYRLDIQTQALVANDAIGNTFALAKDLGSVTPSLPIAPVKDAIGGADPADWFRFSTTKLGNLLPVLDGLTTPVSLQLSRIEANGSLTNLGTLNSNGAANWQPVFNNLAVGNYALALTSTSTVSSPYTFNLSTISTNVAPTNLKLNLATTYGSNQDVIVTGSVYDANGASDIDKVWLNVNGQTYFVTAFTREHVTFSISNYA
jgi:hypothetical protein